MENRERPITINITAGTVVKAIFLIFLFTALFLVRDLVLVVLAAVVIASAIEPFTLRFKQWGIGRIPSVIILYIAFLGLIAGLTYFFLPSLLNDASNFLASAPRYLDSISLWDPLQSKSAVDQSKQAVENLSQNIGQSKEAVQGFSSNLSLSEVISGIHNALSSLSQSFVKSITVVFGGVLSSILIIVISFYLAVQEDGVGKFLRVVTPLRHEGYVIGLWKRVQLKIGRWFQGQLLLAVLVGALVYLGLTIFGVRNAILLAFMAAVFETIPLFGPILAAIPGVAVAYIDRGLGFGLFILGLYIVIQQFENHLIYPLVVKKIVGVPPILVILALIIGLKLAGFLGVLLSVPAATTLMEYFDDMQKDKLTIQHG